MSADAIKDMTRLGRLFGRILTGEMPLTDLAARAMAGAANAAEQKAPAERPRCTVCSSCTLPDGHDDGCLLDAEVTP